jgi:HEAT repeat protein
MGKSRGADAAYEALGALRGQAPSPQVKAQIAAALKHRSNVIVARAAELASRFKFSDLCGELVEAFARFSREADYPDGACIAQTALARAALQLKCPAEGLFLSGIRQPGEAGLDLRILSAIGLVQVRYPDVMGELVDLLTDKLPPARVGAVRALGATGREDAAAVLRLKVHMGDIDPEVIGECFAAMLQVDAGGSMAFVERYLQGDDDSIRDGAALAIGASRHPSAVAILRRHFPPDSDRGFRSTLLLAIATCRTSEAMDFLISLVGDKPPDVGAEAIAALALYRHDSALRKRVELAVQNSGSDTLMREFAGRFGANP